MSGTRQDVAGALNILADLADQVVDPRKCLLRPKALHELYDTIAAIKIAVVVEEVNLQREIGRAHV